jgi:alpha-L-fucosidase
MTSRRDFLTGAAATFAARSSLLRAPAMVAAPDRPHPSPSQLEWQRDELAMFVHFGVNTFTDREWGDGKEDPAIFAPDALDARQWARAARAAGFRTMVLTAKHHDGFCLWPSKTTDHSVAKSPFREGRGDVVREFTDACRAEGLKAGVYLSPWDRNHPAYGDSARYNDVYAAQLTELLTQYGTIHEVWFDGANGEGPNGKRQIYDWPRTWGLVRKLQPGAVIFSDAGPDVRWIGNENGSAGETNWSTIDPTVVPVPGVSGPAVMRMLQQGDPGGSVWRPGETDVSIRPGWFNHVAEDAKVRSVDNLVSLYFSSVGRNSKLLLNVPPTRHGLLNDVDVARLAGMHDRLGALFSNDAARGQHLKWQSRERGGSGAIDLDWPRTVTIVDLSEDIRHGQVVARYLVEGYDGVAWKVLSRGTTIGYRKLDRFAPVVVQRVRLTIEDAVDTPRPVTLRLFAGG